ncbi:MAG: deaminase [Candidatus Nanoarchaeia archaeon]|nr:deaminase [Candidatus Nanoarchaeia archaeon]
MNPKYRLDGKFMMPCKLKNGDIEEKFILHLFSFPTNNKFLGPEEHFHVITLGDIQGKSNVLIRIESACTYAHLYGSQLCDCLYQKDEALQNISKEGEGIYIYCLDQHGRGTGIVNHVLSYQAEQEKNLDTIEAHRYLNFPDDARDYNSIIQILNYFKIKSVRLLTNNPNRIKKLEENGIKVKRIPLQGPLHKYNFNELKTKKEKLGHLYDYNFETKISPPKIEEEFMKYTLFIAKEKGKVKDKPLVGAIVVNNGEVVGEGYGIQGTHLHAEIMAILNAGEKAKNSTLYTTLEPCIDAYNFPSCCREIIKSGISEVIIGCIDPHPIISGRGIKTLENAGIKTKIILEQEAKNLIKDWRLRWEDPNEITRPPQPI